MKKMNMSLFLATAMCMFPGIVLAGEWWSSIQPENQGSLEGMDGTVNSVLGIIQTIGYIVAVVMVMWVGIKYLTAGASEKAKVKDTLVPILVGAILIVAATTITSWLFKIGSTSNSGSGSGGGRTSTSNYNSRTPNYTQSAF